MPHAEVAKATCLNFQVHTFGTGNSDLISAADREKILELLATMDAAVIGPGLNMTGKNVTSIMELLEGCPCPVVVDATAIQPKTLRCLTGKQAVITPHLGELERMGLKVGELPETCKKYGCTILLKGPADTVVSPSGEIRTVDGGNAGLTVGGTGDALAGIVAGLLAQKENPVAACIAASTAVKKAGDRLRAKKGFAYTAREVINEIPVLLATLKE